MISSFQNSIYTYVYYCSILFIFAQGWYYMVIGLNCVHAWETFPVNLLMLQRFFHLIYVYCFQYTVRKNPDFFHCGSGFVGLKVIWFSGRLFAITDALLFLSCVLLLFRLFWMIVWMTSF